MKKIQILIKGHRLFDQANQGRHSWGPTPPPSPALPAPILAKKKKKIPASGMKPDSWSLPAHLSSARPAHSPLCCCHFLLSEPSNMSITSRMNNRGQEGLLLTLKNRLSRSTTLAETRHAFSGEGKKSMRTRQPEGHSPSPTFRAVYLSIKHTIRKTRRNFAF